MGSTLQIGISQILPNVRFRTVFVNSVTFCDSLSAIYGGPFHPEVHCNWSLCSFPPPLYKSACGIDKNYLRNKCFNGGKFS